MLPNLEVHDYCLVMYRDLCSCWIALCAAPTHESQATDALLAVAKMQPLPAVAVKHVAEHETEESKNEVSNWRMI